MTVKTVKTRSSSIIETEIQALKSLIRRRQEWLRKPANRKKSTWEAVNIDTNQMIENLGSLLCELESNENNKPLNK